MNQTEWWRDAVIYEIYIRSFADANGDGDGDVEGIRSRLPYLRDLGVDAIWITPWYRSPMADGGYDVADYRDIQPMFGTLAQARTLIGEAHEHGLKVIIDLVPNHTSDRHPWFRAALAAQPGSKQRERYIFRPGTQRPNDWRSVFGGPAWSTAPDDSAGEWYLHLFAPQQPDLNWEHADVRAEFLDILRFWLDTGVDGFRIDVAHGLVKEDGLPDVGEDGEDVLEPPSRIDHPHWDRDGVHEIYRSWRDLIDTYPGRTFVAEAWVANPTRLARYVRPGELHTAFNFDLLRCSWNPERLRGVIDANLDALRPVGAPATWVLSNHDVTRHVTRYGRARDSTGGHAPLTEELEPVDLELGLRRARAAALLMLALPGSAYLYQGEELGLWEVEDLPEALLQDPTWERSGHTARGRDGCRVPMPWSGEAPPFGFGTGGDARPWLPQPTAWKDYTVEAQTGDEHSMLELYRRALRVRREHPALGDGTLRWVDAPDGVLAFARDPGFRCLVNLSGAPVEVTGEPLLASGPLEEGRLPTDTAVWLKD